MSLCSHEKDYDITTTVWCETCQDSFTEDVSVCPGSGTYAWTCSKCETNNWEKE